MKNKMKTKKAALKRFKITKNGKLCFRQAKMRHLLEHRSSKAKRLKGKTVLVKKTDFKLIKMMLPGL
ncbi:MAG: 50S ribosomal protein L35 [Candidatus Margulisiibacteriota bacterium]|jgi:large subunit ribosomal protein L35